MDLQKSRRNRELYCRGAEESNAPQNRYASFSEFAKENG